MTTIKSTWTRPTPPPLTGLLTASAWSGSATWAIPRGTLMAQNDASNLYIGLDLTAETGTANSSDYFWLVVDINGNGVIDPDRDKLFSDWPGSPNRLGMWLMAGPDENYPASDNQVIPSQCRIGFGASINSATPHRQWQIALALSDLGIVSPIDPTAPAPVIHFGLRIGTLTPAYIGESPTNPLGNFSDFDEIVLALLPNAIPTSTGPIIASVGLVGTGFIGADGYCTIPASANYYLSPQDAAFSGTLNFIGDETTLNSLWAAGARQYKVQHRYGSTVAEANAAAWVPILQCWTNFEVVGTTDVWQSFAANSGGFYPLVDPGLAYTIQNLLFQWTTSSEADGVHQFEFQFFNAAGVSVASAALLLTLALDNQPVTVQLIEIIHAGVSIPACSIVNLTSATDGVQIVYEAYDPEGDLWNYALIAEYGSNQSKNIASANWTSSTPNWQGVSSATTPVWVPPQTCAYLFQIGAWSRTTNGYSFPVLYSSDFKTVTLILPGSPAPAIIPISLFAAPGFPVLDKTVALRQPVKALAALDLKP